MNAYKLNLEDESIDVVVENDMIHLVDNPEQVYQEIYRVLKKDGKFIKFGSYSLQITEEQKELTVKCKDAFKDIRDYYFKTLKEYGYELNDFDNNTLIIQKIISIKNK